MSTTGRPTSFRAEYCKLAHNYCLLGATKAQLAEFFGVTSRTIDNWLATIPEFRDEVQRGRNIADAKVADSSIGVPSDTSTRWKVSSAVLARCRSCATRSAIRRKPRPASTGCAIAGRRTGAAASGRHG